MVLPHWAIDEDVVIDDKNKIFGKKCGGCGKYIYYTRKDYLKKSLEENYLCKSCSKKGKQPSFYVDGKIPEEIMGKISKAWFKKGDGPKNADLRKGKTLEDIYGIERAAEIRIKYSEVKRTPESNLKRKETMKTNWKKNPENWSGRTVSEETRAIHRRNMVKRLKKTHKNFHPPYNEKACEYFDKLMEETNTNIQHALNGGEYHIEELGYWVDGYDIDNNIVYEWDEPHHFNNNGMYKEKDIIREEQIKKHLGCTFIRFKEVDILS